MEEFVAALRDVGDAETDAAKINLAIKRAKARQEEIKATKAEREERTAAGNILDREAWELFAVECVQKARDRFARLPKTLCKHLPVELQSVIQSEGLAEVRKICDELARDLERGPDD